MTTFTVWKFDEPEGAEHAASVLKAAAADGLVKILDHAVISWPVGVARPETTHGHEETLRGAGWGALWGLLGGALGGAGEEPESLDKEVVRRAFADIGYRGDGPVPSLPDHVWTATTERYIDAYERLTGTTFVPGAQPASERILERLTKAGVL